MVAQNMLRKYDVKQVFSWLQQIEIHDLLHMCAPCYDLPSIMSTMIREKEKNCPVCPPQSIAPPPPPGRFLPLFFRMCVLCKCSEGLRGWEKTVLIIAK